MPAGTLRNKVDSFLIDRIRRSSDFDMGQSHYHPYYELYYLLSGTCRMFIGHTIYYVSPGDIILIPSSCQPYIEGLDFEARSIPDCSKGIRCTRISENRNCPAE